VAAALKISRAEVEGVISFYHFLSDRPTGKYVIYLNNSITSEMSGREKVALALEKKPTAILGRPLPMG